MLIYTCNEDLQQLELLHYPNIDAAGEADPSVYLTRTLEWSVSWGGPTTNPVRASFSGDVSHNGRVTMPLRLPMKSQGYFLRVVTSKRDSSISIEDLSQVAPDKVIVSSRGGESTLSPQKFRTQAERDCPS